MNCSCSETMQRVTVNHLACCHVFAGPHIAQFHFWPDEGQARVVVWY